MLGCPKSKPWPMQNPTCRPSKKKKKKTDLLTLSSKSSQKGQVGACRRLLRHHCDGKRLGDSGKSWQDCSQLTRAGNNDCCNENARVVISSRPRRNETRAASSRKLWRRCSSAVVATKPEPARCTARTFLHFFAAPTTTISSRCCHPAGHATSRRPLPSSLECIGRATDILIFFFGQPTNRVGARQANRQRPGVQLQPSRCDASKCSRAGHGPSAARTECGVAGSTVWDRFPQSGESGRARYRGKGSWMAGGASCIWIIYSSVGFWNRSIVQPKCSKLQKPLNLT